jgi:hypothetical protein
VTNTRKVPYGWKVEAGKKVKDTRAQKVIKEILEQHRIGISLAMIAEGLNERGVLAQRGGKWHGSTVRKIIDANWEALPTSVPGAGAAPRIQLPRSMKEAIADAKARGEERFTWEEIEWDEETGQERIVPALLDVANVEEMLVQAEALRNLTLAEKAERFRFYDPLQMAFADCVRGIDKIVSEMTAKRGYDLHQLINEIKDQPREKALIRQLANLLIREVAIQRQTNLALRQQIAEQGRELRELRTAGKHTMK